MNTQVLGISIDHVPCLQAWAENLGAIRYPLLSDFWPHGKVCQEYGVLRAEGYSERAIFLIDRNGVIRYIDVHDIEDQPSNQVLMDEIRKMDPTLPAAPPPLQGETELPHGGIVMYCTKWCMDCRRARAWLVDRGLPYTEVDINANPAAGKQVRAWSNGSLITPTFDIDGTIILDFDIPKIEAALSSKGL